LLHVDCVDIVAFINVIIIMITIIICLEVDVLFFSMLIKRDGVLMSTFIRRYVNK